MSDPDQQSNSSITNHYSDGSLWSRIESALVKNGIDLDSISVQDLASLDGFHIRGHEATLELANKISLKQSFTQPITSDSIVLDLGCGIGGTSRYLADRFSCSVEAIDLTAEFIEVGKRLTEHVKLNDSIHFQVASALDLPFDSAQFDLVWTEHVQMNIEDKHRFYSESYRVLKPGGCLVFHDIFRGNDIDLQFPVPWATEPNQSHLINQNELKDLLQDIGFYVKDWEDTTKVSQSAIEQLLIACKERPDFVLQNTNLINMKSQEHRKIENVKHALMNGSLTVIQAICRK